MAVAHAYTDPTGYYDNSEAPSYEESVGYSKLDAISQEKSLIFSQPLYRVDSRVKERTESGTTYESISFPNPKRGFIAITTYPPVYKSRGSGQTIVVPRQYPPIFIDYYRRNR